jgi:signal transduction histidine kinase
LAGRPSLTAGIGLRSIREQAADLGGKLLVRSGPLGTTLVISVPLET